MRLLPPLLVVALLLSAAQGRPPPSRGSSVLVVGETAQTHDSHSAFLSALSASGRNVTFVPATDSRIPIYVDGRYLYDAVFLLAPRSNLQSSLPASRLLKFVDDGRDLFVASHSAYSSYTSKLVADFGIDLDDPSHLLVDRQHPHPIDDGSSTYVAAAAWIPSVFAPSSASEVPTQAPHHLVFHAPAATLLKDNELVHPLLWASGSSYGRKVVHDSLPTSLSSIPRVAGSAAVMAAAVCTRAQSRATWFGDVDALSDDVISKAGEEHARAVFNLARWAVGDSGELRVKRVSHGRLEDGGATDADGGPADYRVKDVIELVVEVQQWDGVKGEWIGFETEDMQVEFVMLNPWVRTRLEAQAGGRGIFKAKIQVPDQIGVYKFKVEYVRAGYSGIFLEREVAVRPFLHNEYERFIPMAYPYYVGAFSMMIGVFLLGVVIVFSGDEGSWPEAKGVVGTEKSE